MFSFLGRLVTRWPTAVIAVWFLVAGLAGAAALTGLGGTPLFTKLETGQPSVPGTDSARVADLLLESASGATTTLLVDQTDPTAPKVATKLQSAAESLSKIDGVAQIAMPIGADQAASAMLVSADQDAFLVRVTLDEGMSKKAETKAAKKVETQLADLGDELVEADLASEASVASTAMLTRAVNHQMEQDLIRGELIALPISLLVMVVVFGGVLAAGMPIVGALASIAGGLGSIWALSHLMELDSVVINVVTLLGLGLSIDYGLLMVSRFREELQAVVDGPELAPIPNSKRDPYAVAAVQSTVSTSGRTVVFSALTIAMSVGGLIVMSPSLLKGLGVAAASVVLVALLTAVTLVPAVLTLTGQRFVRPSILARVPVLRSLSGRTGDSTSGRGGFGALARWVQRSPWPVMIACISVLFVAAIPVASIHMRNSGVDVLPAGAAERQAYEAVGEAFPAFSDPDIWVIPAKTDATDEQLVTLSKEFAEVDRIESVDPVHEIGDADGHVLIGLRLTDDISPDSAEAVKLVRDLRELDTNIDVWIGGQAAGQADFSGALIDGLPFAGGLVLLATFILLFLMTGSVLVPVKALLTNVLSIAASLGITTWVFQHGHGSGLLGFESVGGLESYVVAVVVAFGFGLAMDYEVFLIARIKEYYDSGMSNNEAVAAGLQSSGRIITSAALVIIVVFIGFASGVLLPIKEAGFALALAVALDATIVRMLLVPATMTVLGDANWWAPKWLQPFARRFAIKH